MIICKECFEETANDGNGMCAGCNMRLRARKKAGTTTGITDKWYNKGYNKALEDVRDLKELFCLNPNVAFCGECALCKAFDKEIEKLKKKEDRGK